MIVRDFEDLMLAHESNLSLGEFVEFSKQLDRAGFTPIVARKGCFMEITYEEPTLKQLFQRGIAFLTNKRLHLTKVQKCLFLNNTPKVKAPSVCPHCGLALKANYFQLENSFGKYFCYKDKEISIKGMRVANLG